MSGMISDMLTASMAKHARVLVENEPSNGHPDCGAGRYPKNSVAAGTDGVEIKSTRKAGGRLTLTERVTSGCASLGTARITTPSRRWTVNP